MKARTAFLKFFFACLPSLLGASLAERLGAQPLTTSGTAINIHSYCGGVFASPSLPSQIESKSYVSDDARRYLTPETFKEIFIDGILQDILTEGRKPKEHYKIEYNPAIDPYAVTLLTAHGRYPFVVHENVNLTSLGPQKFIPLRINHTDGRRQIEIASGNHSGTFGDRWVIGIHPDWLLENYQLRSSSIELIGAQAEINSDLQTKDDRLALLRGMTMSAFRADGSAHPNFRVSDTFIPNNPQKVSLRRLGILIERAIDDDFRRTGSRSKRPARWLSKEPASSGKTVITASLLRHGIFSLSGADELDDLQLSRTSLNYDLNKSLIVFIAPKTGILPDAIATLKDELNLAPDDIIHAYEGKGSITEMAANTRAIGVTINALSSNNFSGLKHILSQRKGADQNIVFIFDEVQHVANVNIWYAGAQRFLNNIYTDGFKKVEPNATVPNVVIHGMTATDWGNGNDQRLETQSFNFIHDPEFFGFRSGGPLGKITGGYISEEEVRQLQAAGSITQQANMSLLQMTRASTMGYTSPFRFVQEFNSWELDSKVRDAIDIKIKSKILRIEQEIGKKIKEDPDFDADLYRQRRIHQARMEFLLRQEVLSFDGDAKKKTVIIDPIVTEQIKSFLQTRKESDVPDHAVVFVSNIDQANALRDHLQQAFNEPGLQGSYGQTEVRSYHSKSGGPDRYNLDWIDDRIVYKKSGDVTYDFSKSREINKILIVVDAVNEGVNIRSANRAVFADPQHFESQATARDILQRLNRFGRVSWFKPGSDVLDLTGNLYVLRDGFTNLRSISIPNRVTHLSQITQSIAQVADESVVPHAEDGTEAYKLTREQETYTFGDSELHEFMVWAATNTPFEDLNEEGMSGLGVEMLNLFVDLVVLESGHLVPKIDLSARIDRLIARRTHESKNIAKGALHRSVDHFVTLYRNFLNEKETLAIMEEAKTEIPDLLVDMEQELRRNQFATEKIWLHLRRELQLLDPYRSDSIVIKMHNRGLPTPLRRAEGVKTLLSFYEQVISYINENLDVPNNHGHTLLDRGIDRIIIHNTTEKIELGDGVASIKIENSTGAYSLLHGERGIHLVQAKDGDNKREGHFRLSIQVAADLGDLQEAEKTLHEVQRRELRGFSQFIVTKTAPFKRDNNIRLKAPFKEGARIEMSKAALNSIVLELLKGQDLYLRSTLHNFRLENGG